MATTPAGLYGPATRVPAIPDTRTSKPEDVAKAMKEWIEVREGVRGDGLDKAVTLRDLLNSGLAVPFDLRHIGAPGLGQIPGGAGADPDIPPTPTNLEASGAFKYIIVTWDFARGYSRLAYFEVWRGVTDVLGDAVLVAQPFGTIYADDVGPGKTYYYWVRAVSDAPAFSPYSSLSGVKGETALDPGYLISLLVGQIGESALNKILGDRINLVDGPLTLEGSVAARIKSETDARNSAIQGEINARIDADVAAAGANAAFVRQYTYNKQESDVNMAYQADITRAGYESYADRVAMSAAADVRDYTYSKATINDAEAAQSTTITTAYKNYADGVGAASAADVRSYAYSKSETTGAIAATATDLRAEFSASGGATQAYVQGYTYSKADFDAAQAGQNLSLTANYSAAITNIKIGGRNLFRRDQTFTDPTSSGAFVAERWPAITDGFTLVGVSAQTGFQRMAVPLAVGPYTLSFNLRLRDGPGILWLDLADTPTQAIAATTINTHYEFHFNVVNAGLSWLDFDKLGAQGYYFTQFKLEEGNKATSYTPAPEDVARDIDDAVMTASADVRSYAYSKAGVDGAIATATQTLQTTVNGYSAAIQTNSTSIDGLKLQYTLKLDNNGYISGYGLASEPVNGTPFSMMIVRADSFSVGSPTGPGVPPSIPFIVRTTVSTINGVSIPIGTYIADAYIANGSISNAKIGNLQVDDAKIANVSVAKLRAGAISVSEYIESSNFASGQAGWRIHGNGDPEFRNGIFRGAVYATAGQIGGNVLVDNSISTSKLIVGGSPDNTLPDPKFRDLTWWGRTGSAVGQWADAGVITGWKDGSSLYLSQGDISTDSKYFELVSGATYLVEGQCNLTPDFNGRLSVFFLIQGLAWYGMLNPIGGVDATGLVAATGQTWSDGLTVQVNSVSPKGVLSFSSTLTLPAAGTQSGFVPRGMIRIRNSHTQGVCEIGGLSITRVVDSTLIGPSAVKTKHLELNTGGNIALGTTGYDAGNGLWFEGPGGGHGARLFAGNSSGAKFLCDPQNGILGLYNARIANPVLTTPFAVSLPYTRITQQIAGTSTFGITPAISGGSGNYTYQWALSVRGSPNSMYLASSPDANSAAITVSGSSVWLYGYISLIVRDVDTGMTASDTADVTYQFGSGPEP